MPLGVVAQLRHSYGSCSIIICIPMGSCSMAREVVTRRTVLHHYCSTKFALNLPRKVLHVLVMTQDEYDILVITQVRGEAEDEC